MRTVAEILRETESVAERGLTTEGVARSRQRFGVNRLAPLPREPLWKKFLEKFDDSIIQILLAAALLSMFVDLFKVSVPTAASALGALAALILGLKVLGKGEFVPTSLLAFAVVLFGVGIGLGHLLVEGLAVMIAVVLATGVAFLSEFKSDREFEILNSTKDSLSSKTIRDGHVTSVPLEEIVVGDVVVLETGDEIPADGRILRANELLVDQSLMTGESEPVRKRAIGLDEPEAGPDQPGCVYRGTQIVDGVGHLLVTDVGDATALGQLARRLSASDDEHAGATEADRVRKKMSMSKELTPLQLKLADLAKVISRVGYAAAGLIFVAQLIRGISQGVVFFPKTGADALAVASELLDYFVTMVIVVVVAVPEGLPMSVTVSLALAMQKMTRANSLVRQLVACETIGSATVICSDKTGTLTQNKMRIEKLSWDASVVGRADPSWPTVEEGALGPESRRPIDWIALNAAVNSTANLEVRDGKTIVIGNSTEGALLQWLGEHRVSYETLRLRYPLWHQVHFTSERKRMTSVVSAKDQLLVFVKGAPERLLDQCRTYLREDGTRAPFDEAARQAVSDRIDNAARQAMRTLAFAYATLPSSFVPDQEWLHEHRDEIERDLVFLGFVAIRDPLRDDVKDAIAQCRAAGIQVKMVTGDNVTTARAIAHDIGLVPRLDEPIDVPGAAVLTSTRFAAMSDDEVKASLPGLRVLARAQPLDKYRLVRLLQDLGEVVAVTGDGTNDAPALKKADVGLAMGIAGTEVSKEASKIVLLDDAFSTIVKAVHWGRALYENIQRFLQFQLTINVSALLITFLGVLLFDVRAPFTVLQLLWINVIMDTFASIALCSEPPRAGLMRLPPKKRDESIVTPAMLRTIFLTAAFFVVVMLGALVFMKGNPEKPGWLAGDGAWAAEVGPARAALPADALVREGTGWRVSPDVASRVAGQPATVHFTMLQATLFFSAYVFFQIWNLINCRSLTPRTSGLARLGSNRVFLSIAALIAAGQWAIVTFGGAVFQTTPLAAPQWLAIAGATASVLVFGEIVRRLSRGAE